MLAVEADGIDPRQILGDVPRLRDRQIARTDLGNYRTVIGFVVLVVLRPVEKTDPQKTVVMMNRAQVIDAVNANRLFFQQFPLRVETTDRMSGRSEIVLSGQSQALLGRAFGELPLFQQSSLQFRDRWHRASRRLHGNVFTRNSTGTDQ